jgi:hypothetical protein
METKRKQKMKFKKTDLMEGSVPEGISLQVGQKSCLSPLRSFLPADLPTYWLSFFHQAKSLQEGLREGFEEDDEEDSPAASGARKPALMCPVSGEIVSFRHPMPLCHASHEGLEQDDVSSGCLG